MRKNGLVLSVACLFLCCAPVGVGYAATITAASASYADVSAAVAAASSGDTIQVPAGSVTWGSTLVITKAITLAGAGIDQTAITGQRVLIRWNPDTATRTNHGTLTVKGFTFDGNDSTSAQAGYTGLVTVDEGSYNADVIKVIVINNKFKNTTATGVWTRGTVYGVVAANTFDRVAMPIRAFGTSDATVDGYMNWNTLAQEYGTENNLYFEDNTITFSSNQSGGMPGWIESGQGGRIAVRYNTWNVASLGSPSEYWDIHGLQNSGTSYATMVAEYYGNKIINDSGTYRWMYHRGGWLMMFNNTTDRTYAGCGAIGVTAYYCDSVQIHGTFVQKANNTYLWNNMSNGTNRTGCWTSPGTSFPGCQSDPPTENQNFYNYTSSFDGTAGVGCGTLANRPATCTTGVGYWATNQNCSNLAGLVGANPATPISGTFYKCTAPNTWTAYYTPYTYPHPLRQAGTLNPPQRLRISR